MGRGIEKDSLLVHLVIRFFALKGEGLVHISPVETFRVADMRHTRCSTKRQTSHILLHFFTVIVDGYYIHVEHNHSDEAKTVLFPTVEK